jgi:hypothetical protein
MSINSMQSVDIAHLIQVALTPIFLISAIGVTLNVLTSRLSRIVDRARVRPKIAWPAAATIPQCTEAAECWRAARAISMQQSH